MKQILFSKKLNNTELGKGNTHETYILVPSSANVDDLFETDSQIEFEDTETNKKYKLRVVKGNETRIVGLGEYYRTKELNAGDMLILRRIITDISLYYIDYIRYDNTLIIQKNSKGFELLTQARIELLSTVDKDNLNITFKCKAKKRKDSPFETEFYNIEFLNKTIDADFKNNELAEILIGENIKIRKFNSWKKIVIEEN